ncbi:hypothetical protein DH2020_012051 [Rehmannia glutinosa]|uniref:Xyloglucan 6-xylosyltransferase n=1 Tax=Rehmannia glutinosa TaxID=99300 RepID=A0ABR0XF55_REHGL
MLCDHDSRFSWHHRHHISYTLPETRITRHVDQDTDGSWTKSDPTVTMTTVPIPWSPNDSYTLGPKISNRDGSRQRWLEKTEVFQTTLHNIEIVYNLAHLDHELSGYWSKLPLIKRLMLSHPEMEWIWWMDSDAFFTDMRFEIPISKYNGYNLVVHGYSNLLFDEKSWIALNTGSFLIRNCQWSLDLLDAWAPMGPKGRVRDEAGKILTANLKGRPLFEADDQSALIYLLISRKDEWMDKVFLENSYYLHGFWVGLVDRYEEYIEQYSPGFGDDRWPFVTHFVGCKPCGGYGDYSFERCLKSMERAFNFADNQVLKLYGFGHRGLLSPNVKRNRNDTSKPLEIRDEFNEPSDVLVKFHSFVQFGAEAG